MKWTRRHDGAPLKIPTKETPKPMTTNPSNKVVSALQTLKSEIDAATDDIIADAKKQSERTKDGFHKLKAHVITPWDDANRELEDYLNQLTNGGPPLED